MVQRFEVMGLGWFLRLNRLFKLPRLLLLHRSAAAEQTRVRIELVAGTDLKHTVRALAPNLLVIKKFSLTGLLLTTGGGHDEEFTSCAQ